MREISDDLLQYQGLARPANSSFGVRFTKEEPTQFGQGMSYNKRFRPEKQMHNLKDIRALSHFQKLLADYLLARLQTLAIQLLTGKSGDIAHHKKWGDGTVLEVTGSGKTQELKIKFPEVGLKKVLASVAPIEKK